MTKYDRSPWIDDVPKSRLPSYPRQRGNVETDVVIIGGGLTGCVTAYTFAAAGIRVALVESGRIGQGTSGASSGWIGDDPDVDFAEVEKELGLRKTRHAWQLWRRAALDGSTLVRRLNLKCELEAKSALVVASTPEQIVRLKREQKVRRDAGLQASLLNARSVLSEAGTTAEAALRSRDGATIHPFRAALGFADAAARRGAEIYESSPVGRVAFNRRSVKVHTAGGGTMRARRVVVATGQPTTLFRSLQRHFWFKTSFLALTERVPAKLRRQLGARQVVVRDSTVPSHLIRWVDDERLLVMGADGDSLPDRQRGKVLIQRTGQLMYELSTIYPDISGIMPEYGWGVPYAKTADGLPFIGPHRNYPHHLFAFGGSSRSVTGAFVASRILLRHHLAEVGPADEAFAFRLEKRL